MKLRNCLLAFGMLALLTPAAAQDDSPPDDMPEIPSLDTVEQSSTQLNGFVPLDLQFRIGVVGEFQVDLETANGVQHQAKNPLILINPANAEIGVFAKNFPARIVASSPNGEWVVGVAPSYAVEGSSGSGNNECAVSLNLSEGGVIRLIKEFPKHSSFQALFDPRDNNTIYYCINEPAAVNKIIRFNLSSEEKQELDFEGNRFYMLGLKPRPQAELWVMDPLNTKDYPVLKLLDLQNTKVLDTVEFPGANEVIVSPSGEDLLVSVHQDDATSLGVFNLADSSYTQVPGLTFEKPTFKWAHNSHAIIAKESTMTHDQFIWVDLDNATERKLFSAYFKVAAWDIADNDDALVFVSDAPEDPVLFVLPLDPSIDVINRIRLKDVTNITWLGCLNPPHEKGSWLDRLLPF